MPEKTICLVSPGHLGSNPRLVKEADALAEAGYTVEVIYGDTFPPARVRDEAILQRARWGATSVSLGNSRSQRWCFRGWQAVFRTLFSAGWHSLPIAVRAHHLLTGPLTAQAIRTPAALYIGHCLGGLPAVIAAAKHHGTLAGFDAEDFHSGEQPDEGRGRLDNAIAWKIESAFLPQCRYFTAASPLIAEEYARTYGVRPEPILNVFPLAEAVEPKPAPAKPSFYWFSQTIGPGRGLERFLEILATLDRRASLDLRGHCSPDYRDEIIGRGFAAGVEVRILSPDLPETMVAHCAGYTAGLALEQNTPVNRDLCLTNKAFTYLLAGVPVILSRTRAQERLAGELGKAGLLIDIDAPVAETARRLAGWIGDTSGLYEARAEAFRLGRARYNWDEEKKRFLKTVSVQPKEIHAYDNQTRPAP